MRFAIICLTTLLVATPATAQLRKGIVGPPPPSERIPSITDSVSGDVDYDPALARDIGDVRETIRDARDDGTLTRREARRLSRENRQIGALADRYGRDGLSTSERAELETRAHVLRDQVNSRRLAGRTSK